MGKKGSLNRPFGNKPGMQSRKHTGSGHPIKLGKGSYDAEDYSADILGPEDLAMNSDQHFLNMTGRIVAPKDKKRKAKGQPGNDDRSTGSESKEAPVIGVAEFKRAKKMKKQLAAEKLATKKPVGDWRAQRYTQKVGAGSKAAKPSPKSSAKPSPKSTVEEKQVNVGDQPEKEHGGKLQFRFDSTPAEAKDSKDKKGLRKPKKGGSTDVHKGEKLKFDFPLNDNEDASSDDSSDDDFVAEMQMKFRK